MYKIELKKDRAAQSNESDSSLGGKSMRNSPTSLSNQHKSHNQSGMSLKKMNTIKNNLSLASIEDY
jgi:hypothetical protein